MIEEPEPIEPVVQPSEPGEAIAAVGESGQWTHRFTFRPKAGEHPNSVDVAGDFNSWSTDATPMKESDGVFAATLPMTEGRHAYKLVVDGKWTTDPDGDHSLEEPDTFGGKNSGLMVGPDGRDLPKPEPNSIRIAAVHFSPDDARDCDVVSTKLLEVSLRAQTEGLTGAAVWIRQGKTKIWERHELTQTDRRLGFDRYTALVEH